MNILNYNIINVFQKYEKYNSYKVNNINTKKNYIAFNYPKNDEANIQLYKYQLHILRENKSNNFLKLIEDVNSDNSFSLIYEDCPSNLYQYIQNCKDKKINIPEKDIIKILLDICNGLSVIHEKYIAHGNLCPELIYLNESNSVKICGFTNLLFSDYPYHVSIKYCSPELLNKEPERTTASDIWSIGVILYELCTLDNLFKGYIDITDYITNDYEIPDIPNYSDKLNELISDCLSIDAEDRPEISEIIELFN